MINKKNFLYLSKAILTPLFICLFVYYFVSNKEKFDQLTQISPIFILIILIGQLIIIGSNVAILITLVRLTGKNISLSMASKIIAYSSVVNFFGFLQAGLGVRAWYLKKYKKISFKLYSLLTLIQYMFIFSLAFLMIIIGLIINGQFGLLEFLSILGVSCLGIFILLKFILPKYVGDHKFYKQINRSVTNKKVLSLIGGLLLLSVIQLAGSTLAFAAELSAIGVQYGAGSILIYSGLAQFSILIALTPGALGFKEGILLALKEKMMISSSEIIISSTLDRLVYFITLTLMMPLYLSFKKNTNAK